MLNLLLPRADKDPPPSALLLLFVARDVARDVAPSVAPPGAFIFNFGRKLFISVCITMPARPKSSSIAVRAGLCRTLQTPSGAGLRNDLPGMPMRFDEGATAVWSRGDFD